MAGFGFRMYNIQIVTKEFDASKIELKEIAIKVIAQSNIASHLSLIPITDGVEEPAITQGVVSTGYIRFGQPINFQNKNTLSLKIKIGTVLKPIIREISAIINLIHDGTSRQR
jgi:hypothetical protein